MAEIEPPTGPLLSDVEGDEEDQMQRAMLATSPSSTDSEKTAKKKLLFRLCALLHKSGNFSFRTERTMWKVSRALGLTAQWHIFPVTAMVSFRDLSRPDLVNESHSLSLPKPDMNFRLMDMLNTLCHQIGHRQIDLYKAESIVDDLEVFVSPVPWWMEATLGYGVTSAAACGLFFGGSWVDVGFAYAWGLVVFCLTRVPFRGFAEMSPFVSAFVISFLATILDRFVFAERNCLYAQIFGGLVWLLPGVSIACSVQELYSNMIVYGSARLIFAIFQALMLGFGLLAGYRVVYSDRAAPDSLKQGCAALPDFHGVSPYFVYLLLPLMSLGSNMLMGASKDQQPGMVICAAVAQGVSSSLLTYSHISDAVPLLAATATGAAARLMAWQRGHDPLPYMLGGIVVLVPGGVGVHGFAQWASGDAIGGGNFTFTMLSIGVSLALGLFISQLPKKNCLIQQSTTSSGIGLFPRSNNLPFVPLIKGGSQSD